MSTLKKALIIAVVLVALGTVAKLYNQQKHYDMALAACGSKDNIKRVDSSGFECIKPLDSN